MRKVLFFLEELRFQLSWIPSVVWYAIITMVAYPVSFPVVLLTQGFTLSQIHDGWKVVTPSILRIEAVCLFIITLWVIRGVVKTITFFKKKEGK